MTDVPGAEPPSFSQVDDTGWVPELVDYLERVAALPEVRRWHHVALELMHLAPGQRVLDVGTGVGNAARDVAPLVDPGPVTAVDVSTQMVAAAMDRDGGRSGVTYEIADVRALPYPAGSFDRVRCERVLQHLADPDAALAELVRVTAPRGRVCVLDTDWQSMTVDVDEPDLVDTLLRHFLTVLPQPDIGRTLRRRLIRAGLTDVEIRVLPFTYTALADAAVIFPFLDEHIPAVAELVPDEIRAAWFDALNRAEAEGTLWVAALAYVGCGAIAG